MVLQVAIKYAADALLGRSTWNFVFILGFLLYIYWRRNPHPKFPPGPKGIPLLGVVPFLSEQPTREFKKWSLKYGPIMSIRLGRESLVVVNDFDSFFQAFVKQGNKISDRPWIQLFCSATKHHGIIFKKYGEDFKAQKHFALKYLRERGLAKKQMESAINDEGDMYIEHLQNLQRIDKQVDIKNTIYQATANIISQVIFGTRAEYGDPSFQKLLHTLAILLTDPEHVTRQSLIFVWNSLAKLPYFSTSMQAFDEKMEYILSKIQEKINDHKIRFDSENIRDFVDAFLFEQEYRTRPEEQGFTEVQLRTVCRDVLMAGSETSSSMLSWLFVLYLNFPECQKNIDEEINNVLGPSKIPGMANRSEMPFTCAFIQESMRYRVISPMAQHQTITDVVLQGFVIPKGTTVIANVQGVHIDPVDWPNPEQFDPFRHIDENGQFVISTKIIPFGIGSRFCLGESLARVEIFILFVKILQKFRVRSARNYPPPLDKPLVASIVSPRECVVSLELRY